MSKKAEFIKSLKFDALCTDKVMEFFKLGFKVCVSQLWANDYLETKNLVHFLDCGKALYELLEEGEVTNEEAKKEKKDEVGEKGPKIVTWPLFSLCSLEMY